MARRRHGFFTNGVQDGLWIWFTSDGVDKRFGIYHNGVAIGPWLHEKGMAAHALPAGVTEEYRSFADGTQRWTVTISRRHQYHVVARPDPAWL